MKLNLKTDTLHTLELQGTTSELNELKSALGRFSLFDFRKVQVTPEEQKAFSAFHTFLEDITRVLV
jgi:hypothetical protein